MGVGFGLMLMIGFAGEEPSKAIGVGGFLVILGLAFFINSLFDNRVSRRCLRPDRLAPEFHAPAQVQSIPSAATKRLEPRSQCSADTASPPYRYTPAAPITSSTHF